MNNAVSQSHHTCPINANHIMQQHIWLSSEHHIY